MQTAQAYVLQNLFYVNEPIIDLSDSERLNFLDMRPNLMDTDKGFQVGSRMKYDVVVQNRIKMKDYKETTAYADYLFDNDSMAKSDFVYALTQPGAEPIFPRSTKTRVRYSEWSKQLSTHALPPPIASCSRILPQIAARVFPIPIHAPFAASNRSTTLAIAHNMACRSCSASRK